MLYKAAIKEAEAIKIHSSREEGDHTPIPAPHPYTLALEVLSIQKVSIKTSTVHVCILIIFILVMFTSGQYLLDDCPVESFSEFKASLEKRARIRLELIEDLHKKRVLSSVACVHACTAHVNLARNTC